MYPVRGYGGRHIPDFGEPLLRQVYDYGMEEVAALDAGLRAIALCPFQVALLHYAPTCETLVGERSDIWTFLGTDRLAGPISEHSPDLIGEVPVHNVAVPLMGENFWELEMAGDKRIPSEVH